MSLQPRIVITGGSGFIGTNAVSHFDAAGYVVLNLDLKKPQDLAHLEKWRECDVGDDDSLGEEVIRFQPDFILHLASRTDLDGQTIEEYSMNHIGVRNILDIAPATPALRRIIFASSRMVCPIGYVPETEEDYNPPNPYGVSKVLGEKIIRARKMAVEWIIVRPTSIWGPWFGVPYRKFFEMIERGLYFNPAGHDPEKSFGYVENTVFQIEQLFCAPAGAVSGRTFYLCDYTPLHVSEWARMIERAFSARRVVTVPMILLRAMARIGDACKRLGVYEPPITTFRLTNLISDMIYDTSELARICGPLPFSLEEGVRRTVAWLAANSRKKRDGRSKQGDHTRATQSTSDDVRLQS